MKLKLALTSLILMVYITVPPAYARCLPGLGEKCHQEFDVAVKIEAQLTVNPLLILAVDTVKDDSSNNSPVDSLLFKREVTPDPNRDETPVDSQQYKVWIYSNAPWSASFGRTAVNFLKDTGNLKAYDYNEDKNLRVKFRKNNDHNWNDLHPYDFIQIKHSEKPTGKDGEDLGRYQFRCVIDHETIPGTYKFDIIFGAYQE